MNNTNELSIFIDESGDIGNYNSASQSISDRYYLISLVFHDQNESIEPQIEYLKNRLINDNFRADVIHAGPLIRKEKPFQDYDSEDVFKILRDMLHFVKKSPIRYYLITIDKLNLTTSDGLRYVITNQMSDFINHNYSWLKKFDLIKIYYDNGQKIVSESLKKTFCEELNCKINKVKPQDYFLFQVADFICTCNLIEIKRQKGLMSNSEQRIFTPKTFKKLFISEIVKKKI